MALELSNTRCSDNILTVVNKGVTHVIIKSNFLQHGFQTMGLRVSNSPLSRMGPANWHGSPLANLILEVSIFSDRELQDTRQDNRTKYHGHTMILLIF